MRNNTTVTGLSSEELKIVEESKGIEFVSQYLEDINQLALDVVRNRGVRSFDKLELRISKKEGNDKEVDIRIYYVGTGRVPFGSFNLKSYGSHETLIIRKTYLYETLNALKDGMEIFRRGVVRYATFAIPTKEPFMISGKEHHIITFQEIASNVDLSDKITVREDRT